MVNETLEEIKKLKKKRNAIILAHNYQKEEIQEIADFVGDSLELSRIAAQVKCDVIVFCGVHFMAYRSRNSYILNQRYLNPFPDELDL